MIPIILSQGSVYSASRVPFIVLLGESGASGLSANANATAGELAAQSQVQIWNNDEDEFQDLDIGTNNITGHDGSIGSSPTYHGMELQLANAVAAGRFTQDEVYLLKTGHGGSQIQQWRTDTSWKLTNNGTNPDGGHVMSASGNGLRMWEIAAARIAACKAAIAAAGKVPIPIVWISLGLNDATGSSVYSLAATSNYTTFQADVESLISRLRTELGAETRVVLTKFENPMQTTASVNAVYDAIALADPLVATVTTKQAETRTGDARHLSYLGNKLMAERMIDATFGLLESASAPSVSPAAGDYTSEQSFTLTPAAGAIRTLYTTNDNDPLVGSVYSGAITATPALNLRAVSIVPNKKSTALNAVMTNSAKSAWSTADASGYFELATGNRRAQRIGAANAWHTIRSTLGRSSGKLYAEFAALQTQGLTNGPQTIFGFVTSGYSAANYIGQASNGGGWGAGTYRCGSGFTAAGGSVSISPTNSSQIMLAIDFAAGTIWIGHNGTWAASGDPAAGTNPAITFTPGGALAVLHLAMSHFNVDGSEGKYTLQTAADQLSYSPPSGFSAWDS